MSKLLSEVAKDCNVKVPELINYLREKGVDANTGNTKLDTESIKLAYSFYGVPMSKLGQEKPKAVKPKRILYDADGNPIKKQYDENGKEIPYTGPVFDENGNQLVRKKKKQFFDKDGNPVKRELDENGKPLPFKFDVYDENGKKIVLKKKNETKKTDAEKEEAPKASKKKASEAPEKAEKTEKGEKAVTTEEKPAAPRPVKLERVNVYDERKKREALRKQETSQNQAGRTGGRDGQGRSERNGDRNGRNGGFNKGDRNNNGNFRKDSRPGQGGPRGGFNKDGFGGKDKDADQPRRNFTKKNDTRSAGNASFKSEMGKEFSRDKRAAEFNERKKDKQGKNKGYNYDDDGLRRPKKKDPNRKGAFIMPKPVEKKEEDPNEIKTITVPETITIKALADKLKKNSAEIIKKLFLEGKMYSINSEIPFEEAEEIAMGYEVLVEKEEIVDIVEELMKDIEDPEDSLVKRPPVVCVMGHVDHGKTSILDAIRNTHVTSREAGGITQHIGAYMVEINGRKITFLDTPGHEAFTTMRLRGAMATDIAILVVAADDGVMPQTIEAINHAKAAGIQIVVAINKMDKEGANPDRVMSELSEQGLVSEEWGGSTTMVKVSAKKGEGLDDLLEMILLTADVLELKANPNRTGRGLVLEARLDKGRGPVANVLVKKGTLKVGDNIVAGPVHGKVRAMINDLGKNVKEATPSTPVSVLGLNGVPTAGDEFVVTETDKEARTIAEAYIAKQKEELIKETKAKLSLDSLYDQIQEGKLKELNVIVKADVQGSVEAVKQSISKLTNDEVAVRVIHSGAGNINESDVILASASNAVIIGFNVKPDNAAKETAEKEKVDLRLYNVIYNAIDDIEAAMNGMLDPVYEEIVIGKGEIRQIFKASGIGNIAGSYITDGKAARGCSVRVFRGEEKVYEGPLASLKRFKDDVKEVQAGFECGLVFEKFDEFQEGDTMEFYHLQEVPRNREKK